MRASIALAFLSALVASACTPGAPRARSDGGVATSTQTTTTATAGTTTATAARASTATTAALGGRTGTAFERELMRHSLQRYSGDLSVIRQKGVLRVLTRNNSSNYFVMNGQERGFQYELAKAFADELGLRLAVIVPSSRSALETALLDGEGDLIAAGTTITATRAERFDLTSPVRSTSRVVVVPARLPRPPTRLEELVGLPVHVSFRSTTHASLVRSSKSHRVSLTLVDVEDDVEMEEMIERVAAGDYPATIADRDVLDLAVAGGAPVVAAFALDEQAEQGWVMRKGSTELTRAADDFIRRHRRDGLIKIFYDRYFTSRSAARTAAAPAPRADERGRLSRWDHIFKREGARLGVDWRLLAAIAFTESRFDPAAKSAWGAVGLMQILPSTARGMGFTAIDEPEPNIRAGATYFKSLLEQFDDPGLELRQRVRFALAAYNAGLGHVSDARRLAPRISRDPNVWFGNVEKALELKRDRRWHEQTRFGFCRAVETVSYVSRVQSTYDVYARHAAE